MSWLNVIAAPNVFCMFLIVDTFRNHPTNQNLVEWPGLSPAMMKTKRKRTEVVVFYPGKDTWDVAN
jgi:hypothetical protein